MLQAELTETTRLHIFDPRLVTMKGLRRVHDHRFIIDSRIVFGSIRDVPYYVEPSIAAIEAKKDDVDRWRGLFGHSPRGFVTVTSEVPVFAIKHAKIMAHDNTDFQDLGPHYVAEDWPRIYSRGETYRIARRDFHTTVVDGFAVTIIRRSDFDDKPARVLQSREPGIVLDDSPEHKQLVEELVQTAETELGRLAAEGSLNMALPV